MADSNCATLSVNNYFRMKALNTSLVVIPVIGSVPDNVTNLPVHVNKQFKVF